MYENIYLQIYVFLYTLYGGIIIGITYDLVDVLVNNSIIKRRSISDLFFWAVAFSIIVALLFYVNNITFRGYVVIGFALGWFVYFYTLSKFFRLVFMAVKKVLKRIWQKMTKLLSFLTYPVKKILTKTRLIRDRNKKMANKVFEDFKKYKSYLFKN